MSAVAFPLPQQLANSSSGERAGAPRRPGTDAQHLAWQREMERAEGEAWFRTSSDGTSSALIAPALAVPLPPAQAIQAGNVEASSTSADAVAAASLESGAEAGATAEAQNSVEHAAPSSSAPAGRAPQDKASTIRTAGDAGRPAQAMERASFGPVLALAGAGAVVQRSASALLMSLPASMQGSPASAAAASVLSPTLAATAGLTGGSAATTPMLQTATLPASLAVPASPGSPGSPIVATAPRAATERLSGAIARALEATPPVRLHVEWNDGAATVWIGLDTAAGPELPELVDALSRWMSRIGMRLRSVVCNGASCFEQRGAFSSSSTDVDVIVDRET